MNEESKQAGKASTIDLLRRIHPNSWAEVAEPSGWTYHTNIGVLAHQAADEIERLQAGGVGEMIDAAAKVLLFTRKILEGTYDRVEFLDAMLNLSEAVLEVQRGRALKSPDVGKE